VRRRSWSDALGLVLVVERFPACVERFMLRADGHSVRFKREQMRFQLF